MKHLLAKIQQLDKQCGNLQFYNVAVMTKSNRNGNGKWEIEDLGSERM